MVYKHVAEHQVQAEDLLVQETPLCAQEENLFRSQEADLLPEGADHVTPKGGAGGAARPSGGSGPVMAITYPSKREQVPVLHACSHEVPDSIT